MIKMYPFCNAVTVSHMLLEPYAQKARVLVDMTSGNGHDTAFLARLMPDDAVLYAFDIQACAVEKTKARLREEGLDGKDVRCRCGSHDVLLEEVQPDVDVIVFNLGYLPSGDHSIHTNCEITLKAVKIGLNKIAKNGIIMIAAYPGTEAGDREEKALHSFLQTIPQKDFHVSSWQPVNEVHCPPLLYIVQKRGKRHYEEIPLHQD
nr:class I SAM-dependent methyltransferase [uncultured Megasphaera sp.]